MVWVGGNAKMNEFQAAMGLCNLRHVDEEIGKRKKVVERYMEHLGGLPGLKLPHCQKGLTPNYAYFPVVFDGFGADRNQIYDALAANDIYPRKYFYPLINDFQCYEGRPLYAGLSVRDVDRICRILKECGTGPGR